MPINHKVESGECLESIAHKYEHYWKSIWEHPDNKELKEKRKEPNILFAGDVIVIPDKKEKWFKIKTGKLHKFRKKGTPTLFHMRFHLGDKPRANEKYTLTIDGEEYTGSTDGNGEIKQIIQLDAKIGFLTIGEGENEIDYVILLGYLDPIDEISGIQQRLILLGYKCKYNGELTDETRLLLKDFQKKNKLEESGEPDQPTKDKLLQKCKA